MTPAVLIFFALAGGLAGVIHFRLLGRTVALWLGGGSPIAAAALHVGRFTLTVAILALAARAGWPALLVCAAGVLAGRAFALRRAMEASP